MQTLVVANHKGGVGKSSTATQYAYYLANKGQRTLLLDFDHQMNTSKTIKLSGRAVVSSVTTTQIFNGTAGKLEEGDFVLVTATRELSKLEKMGLDTHNKLLNNLKVFLDSVSDRFDACIIDTNGNPDIRLTAALVLAGYVLSPIQLNQEAIDGIGDLITDIKNIRRLNPALQLIGILPNMVQATPFQKANFAQIAAHHAGLLIETKPGNKDFAHIPNRSVIPEAQAAGLPLWDIKKTAARDAWKELEPYFKVIAQKMNLEF